MRQRRGTPEFSISFLDVICCGFGAVILLLMITKTVQPKILEQSTVQAEGKVAELTEQLFEIRGETTILNRELDAKREQISQYKERIAILQGALAKAQSRYDALETTRNTNSIVQQQLAIARQQLSEEEKRLLGINSEKKNQLIGGIPVDSEYIIFVIDTSGSMLSLAWSRMLKEIEATLSIYPEVKGIQVLNDNGVYLYPRLRGEWIKDSPEYRSQILSKLESFGGGSNSSPVEGITTAIKTYGNKDYKVSIYVFGDEFLRGSTDKVLEIVKMQNTNDFGDIKARIHAVGFPNLFSGYITPGSGERFATLMRKLAYQNGGTFVGLTNTMP